MLVRSAGRPARWPPPVAGPVATILPAARVLAALLLLLAGAGSPLAAQTPTPSQPVVRYHFGDDSQWASPNFDDSGWPVAPNGLVPSVTGRPNRFLWVRMRVPVAPALHGPLALHLNGLGIQPAAWQAFVNGTAVGGQGSFPPRADPASPPVSPVMALPAALVAPGSTVLVALREWQAPSFFETQAPGRPAATIDEQRPLQLAVRADAAEALAENAPEDALSALLALVGVVLLFFWRGARRREYLWAAMFLVVPLLMALLHSASFTSRFSYREQALALAAVNVLGLIAEIEFMWAMFGLRSPWLHVFWHSLWVAFIAAEIGEAWFLASPAVEHLCRVVILVLLPVFDAILFPVCIRELFRRGGKRAFAAAMCLMEVTIALAAFGYSVHVALGHFTLDLLQLTLTMVDLTIAGLLIGHAVRAWREGNGLRVEFEAAREVQRQLVTDPPATPGFRIESAYHPATQVGGDFFRVLPDHDGSVLIVVGDVSGKGLRAAMTVSTIIGSLRTLSARNPADILNELNRSLAGNLRGGFVTCCAAHFSPDGLLTLANAGHLPPYRDGEEIPLPPGLPLGITSAADYTETAIRIAAGETLTFLSDGVLEARNATGELFGFDRTRQISVHPAQAIAAAAQNFSQEDDITVLTLTRPAVPVAAKV